MPAPELSSRMRDELPRDSSERLPPWSAPAERSVDGAVERDFGSRAVDPFTTPG